MSQDAGSGPDLRLKHVFSRAWSAFKERPWLMLGATFIFLVINALFNGRQEKGPDDDVTGFILLAGLVLAGPLMGGLYSLSLRVVRGEQAGLGMLFGGFRRFFRLVAVYVLFLLGSLLGMCLLVVPGIIFGLGCWPAFLVAMETELGPVDSLRGAWALSKGHKWSLFRLGLAMSVFNVLGMLALGVGFILTMAVTNLVFAAAYDELLKEPVP